MSTSTLFPSAAPTSTSATTHPQQQALLPILFPYFLTFLRKSFHFAIVLPKYTIALLTAISHSAIISPLTYILAPLITFATILFSITLRTPWKFLTWLIQALFPLYVFCGIACITGALLGFGGRVLCLSIMRVLEEQGEQEKKGQDKQRSKPSNLDADVRSTKRRKLEREVKFESEDSDS